jgi:hypothetical protein
MANRPLGRRIRVARAGRLLVAILVTIGLAAGFTLRAGLAKQRRLDRQADRLARAIRRREAAIRRWPVTVLGRSARDCNAAECVAAVNASQSSASGALSSRGRERLDRRPAAAPVRPIDEILTSRDRTLGEALRVEARADLDRLEACGACRWSWADHLDVVGLASLLAEAGATDRPEMCLRETSDAFRLLEVGRAQTESVGMTAIGGPLAELAESCAGSALPRDVISARERLLILARAPLPLAVSLESQSIAYLKRELPLWRRLRSLRQARRRETQLAVLEAELELARAYGHARDLPLHRLRPRLRTGLGPWFWLSVADVVPLRALVVALDRMVGTGPNGGSDLDRRPELSDPYDGKPLRVASGRIYSVGPNGRDDHGEADDIAIALPAER